MVGGDVYRKSIELLKPFGRLVVAGYASIPFQKWNPLSWWKTWKNAPKVNMMQMAIGTYGVMATHIGYLTQNESIVKEQWDDLKAFLTEHRIKPVVGKIFPFDRLPDAHAYMESRQSVGKILVRI